MTTSSTISNKKLPFLSTNDSIIEEECETLNHQALYRLFQEIENISYGQDFHTSNLNNPKPNQPIDFNYPKREINEK